jgi:hypothetical protein
VDGCIPEPREFFDGLYVFRATAEDGFAYLGRLNNRAEEQVNDWSYWSFFTRGVFIGENVYSVSNLGVVGAPVSDVDSAPWRVVFPIEEPNVVEPVESPEPVDVDPDDDGKTTPGSGE